MSQAVLSPIQRTCEKCKIILTKLKTAPTNEKHPDKPYFMCKNPNCTNETVLWPQGGDRFEDPPACSLCDGLLKFSEVKASSTGPNAKRRYVACMKQECPYFCFDGEEYVPRNGVKRKRINTNPDWAFQILGIQQRISFLEETLKALVGK
jgi:hypothetical protein